MGDFELTCVVGVEAADRVFLAADSAGVSDWDLTVRADEKVFVNGPMVMGFTSSFRMGQLLRYSLTVPEQPVSMSDDFRFMATLFVDAVRACLKAGGFAKIENSVDVGGVFLVGYRGKLYKVESDFQVSRAVVPFDAVGCGAAYALGALAASSSDTEPPRRLGRALEISESFSAGVRGPFTVAVGGVR